MHIAIEGCLHGELDKVYATLLYVQQVKQIKIDLLICCGDFQSLRNKEDMYCMSCPEKFMTIGNFYEYYSGKKKAPILTIFIGGNHEASNYLRELQFGGWVAENIYYLGTSNVVNVRKGNQQIKVGSASGIFKDYHFKKGYFEKMPLNDKAKKSIYHLREFDVYKLNFVNGEIDTFISHDWPLGIHQHGDVNALLRVKPFFRQEIQTNTLGNPAMNFLVHKLTPRYWFSAHLHVKFAAEVHHENTTKTTKFVALDKCLPHRDFIQIIHITGEEKAENNPNKITEEEETQPVELLYDLEWLAIQKVLIPKSPVSEYETNFFFDTRNEKDWQIENKEEILAKIHQEKEFLKTKIPDLKIPLNFKKTVDPYDPKQPEKFSFRDKLVINNQTEDYLKMLNIDLQMFNNFLFFDHEKKKVVPDVIIKDTNEDEIDLGLDSEIIPIQNQPVVQQQPIQIETVQTNISIEELPFL